MTGSDLLLVGAGGHAVGVVEAAAHCGWTVVGYVDRTTAPWLEHDGKPVRYPQDEIALRDLASRDLAVAMGLGGIEPAHLDRRLALFDRYRDAGFRAPAIRHPDATASTSSTMEQGVIVLARAVIQPFAAVARGALINSGAIIEHHAAVGAGAHVAPGAVVLGAARIGECALVGANAVVLPGAVVPPHSVVKAGSRFG